MKSHSSYIKWIDRYSKLVMKWIFICLLVIIIVQTILQVKSIRELIVPTERWEGEQVKSSP